MSPPEPAGHSSDGAKQLLRDRMREVLSAVSVESAEGAGRRIAETLSLLPAWQEASRIALFSTLPGEVDTGSIWEAAIRASKSVLFPRVISGRRLEFAIVEDPAQLGPGRFGVLEPEQGCPVYPLGAEALVLVPGLAFDRQGGRLGRGAGYYDRALSEASDSAKMRGDSRPHHLGIGFELQIVSSVPMGRDDVRMDGVLTEAGVVEEDPAVQTLRS